MLKYILVILCAGFLKLSNAQNPLRIGIIGLEHSHVHGILGRQQDGAIEIVGIVEADKAVVKKYQEQYHFKQELVFNTIEEMILAAEPEAVAAFNNIYDHLKVVEICAPKGIHVMVEKPLAVNMDHARKMHALAKKYQIELLTNYETTWYPSNQKVFELIQKDSIGPVRKIVVRDGHKGPKKIKVPDEFFDWLTDPKLNGGGALTDFGCYGANLTTWLLRGKKPISVTAITQQLQKENNPNVEDEAIIILTYDSANAILQPSWNWPIGRKDMEVYGVHGVLTAADGNHLSQRITTGYSEYREKNYELSKLPVPYHDPFSLLKAVIRKEIVLKSFDLPSLENNMIVTEILDAAAKSARTNKTVFLK